VPEGKNNRAIRWVGKKTRAIVHRYPQRGKEGPDKPATPDGGGTLEQGRLRRVRRHDLKVANLGDEAKRPDGR